MAGNGWFQENPTKRRRLAFMRARYGKVPVCACGAKAYWLWDPTQRDTAKGQPYCDPHLPKAARMALSRLQEDLFEVAPFFDDPEEDVEDTTAWE